MESFSSAASSASAEQRPRAGRVRRGGAGAERPAAGDDAAAAGEAARGRRRGQERPGGRTKWYSDWNPALHKL